MMWKRGHRGVEDQEKNNVYENINFRMSLSIVKRKLVVLFYILYDDHSSFWTLKIAELIRTSDISKPSQRPKIPGANTLFWYSLTVIVSHFHGWQYLTLHYNINDTLLGLEVVKKKDFRSGENISRICLETLQKPHMYLLKRWPSRLGLQNTPTASLQRGNTLPTSVVDMTLNKLMGNAKYPFIAIVPRSTLAWSGSTW